MVNSQFMLWTIWLSVSIFYAYQYVLRVMPNIMLNEIMQQFNVDAAVFGQLSGVYYIGYSLMHLPIGILLDRYGPKKVMTACIALTVIGLLPIIFSEHWMYPLIGRVLMGMGSSAAILGTFKIIRMIFQEKHFKRMLSLSVTIGLIGAIYGGGPVNYLCSLMGYKTVMQIFAICGMLLAGLTYCIVPNVERTPSRAIIVDIQYVLRHPKVMTLCILAGLMVGPLEGFADVWGSAFLKQVYGMDQKMASYLPSMIFVGMCFGAPVLSFIAEKTANDLAVIIGAGAVMAMSFIAVTTGMLSQMSMIPLFILVGIACAYQILAIYKASTYVPDEVAGLTTAVANMVIMSFGYAFHTVIGIVVDMYGGPSVTEAFVYGIGIIPLTLGIALIGCVVLFYQENRGKKKSHFSTNLECR